MKKLDLEEPIFTYYLNVSGMPRQRAEENISKLIEQFDMMGLQVILVMVENKDSELTLLWKGKQIEKGSDNSEAFDKMIDEILKVMEVLSVGSNFGEFKQKLREYKLSKLEE
jgi:hypothetical protein